MTYDVVCEYPADFYPEYDAKLHKKLGYSSASGMGFGIRDMCWCFKTKDGAMNCFNKLLKMRLKGFDTIYLRVNKD